ncbi:unnamed protein product [Lathyrus oleraceus]
MKRMSSEHVFEVRQLENPVDKFAVNLKKHLYSCRRWKLTSLPCVHALSTMKSRNHKVDDYILEYYRKSRYMAVYKHVIYLVNGSNTWVRTEYHDSQPSKYKKMLERSNKMRDFEQRD